MKNRMHTPQISNPARLPLCACRCRRDI